MAKKFGKVLLFTATIGAVAAGAYYYFKNKEESIFDDDFDEDFDDDFDDNFDDDSTNNEAERSYTSLDLSNEESFEPLENIAKRVDAAEPADAVEEFFDDDNDDISLDSI